MSNGVKKPIFIMEHFNNNQRVFLVETYFRTNSFKRVREEFLVRFPGRRAPSKSTIQRIRIEFRNLRRKPYPIKRAMRSMARRVYLCSENEGRHVEGRT